MSGTIWGYASPDEHVPPVEEQVQAIWQIAQELAHQTAAVWGDCLVEREEDTDTPWETRPELHTLFNETSRGDRLVLWDVSRLARHPFSMVSALEFLVHRGLCLYILDFGGEQLELNQRTGPLFVKMFQTVADGFRRGWSRTSKRTQRLRKEAGLAVGAQPGFGKRRIRTRSGQQVDVWDMRQCQLVRELKYRRDNGESFAEIAEDFHERKVKTADGRLWVRVHRHAGRREYQDARLRRVVAWYEALLDRGERLGA